MARKYSGKRKQIRDYSEYAVKKMLKWAQANYQLGNRINDSTIIVSFDPRRQFSYGGWHRNRNKKWRPYINLAFDGCLRFKPKMISEYAWYKDDPVIGERWAKTWKFYVRQIVAHEVSHVIEMASEFMSDEANKKKLIKRFGRSRLSDDHSDTFQKIYRVLRRKYVNRIRKI